MTSVEDNIFDLVKRIIIVEFNNRPTIPSFFQWSWCKSSLQLFLPSRYRPQRPPISVSKRLQFRTHSPYKIFWRRSLWRQFQILLWMWLHQRWKLFLRPQPTRMLRPTSILMLHAQILFMHLVCTQTPALAAAFPVLKLFTRVHLYHNRRLLELWQPIITQILHVPFLHRLGFLKNLPQDLSRVLQAPKEDFILKCTQVHLSLTVHLLRFMIGNVYHLVDAVTHINKSPWCLCICLNFTSYFL